MINQANECLICGEYFPVDLKECPFCAPPKRQTKYRKDDLDEYN